MNTNLATAIPRVEDKWSAFTDGYPSQTTDLWAIVNASCFDWFKSIPDASIHAIVTDPPYGVKEFDAGELEKRAAGRGGIWRLPPSFDGHTRSALPRFTALNERERTRVREFFVEWSRAATPSLRPGAHVILATNTFLSQMVFEAIVEGGLEFRGEIIRLVRTLRGGDRPKGFEDEFPEVCSLPRGCYEPWGVFRKPIPKGMTVGECLRRFETGGLRRYPDGSTFSDVITSHRTPSAEKAFVNHPSMKPQSLMRKLVYAALPLGQGIVVDPFMGSGSTIAAARHLGLNSIGIERAADYYEDGLRAIPKLAALMPRHETAQLDLYEGEL